MKTTEKPKTNINNTLVNLFVERALPGEEEMEFIAVNGRAWRLPKGETSVVPEFVAKVYRQAQEQKRKNSKFIKGLKNEH